MQDCAVIRAYDLGGYGDIAGAIRVASHLNRTGFKARLRPTTPSAHEKIKLLQTDVPLTTTDASGIQVDVAGHYRDDRNKGRKDVPHHYTEDMDHAFDRKNIVPIYMKSGIVDKGRQLPNWTGISTTNPMFYRPLNEWELLRPEQRDARQLVEQIFQQNKLKTLMSGIKSRFTGQKTITDVLDRTDRLGFAHIAYFNAARFLGTVYMQMLANATKNTDKKLSLGLLFNDGQEREIIEASTRLKYNIMSAKNGYIAGDSKMPTLIFLGPQPQMTTSNLFLSSTMPNLVTGDVSLSDAIYGLIAMNGPAFYYDIAPWKLPSQNALTDIFMRRWSQDLATVYSLGSCPVIPETDQAQKPDLIRCLKIISSSLAYEQPSQAMQNGMKEAIIAEIKARFGNLNIDPEAKNGFYVQPGAMFLIQDATAAVLTKIRDDDKAYATVEDLRTRISERKAPVVVVEGVLDINPPYVQGSDIIKGLDEIVHKKYQGLDLFNYEHSKGPNNIDSIFEIHQSIIKGYDINKYKFKQSNNIAESFNTEAYLIKNNKSDIINNNNIFDYSKKNSIISISKTGFTHLEQIIN